MAAAAAGAGERRAALCAPLAGVEAEDIARFDGMIARQAGRRGLDPRLVKAIIAVESQFSETAVSPRGARGLMQVMPATARELGVRPWTLGDPEANVGAGTEYLARLYGRARAKRLAGASMALSRPVIAAYHAGPRALGTKPWPPATRRYVRAVVECWRSF